MRQVTIETGKGDILVDEADHAMLSEFSWCVNKKGYAIAWDKRTRKVIRMHRFILGAQLGILVDHINFNKLDNTRANLRLCTAQENSMNRKPLNKTKYKGVTWKKATKRWCASIKRSGHQKHLGYFATEEEARLAYNKAAKELHGEFAYINPAPPASFI